MIGIKEIRIEAELWEDGWDYEDTNSSVLITFKNGDEYAAHFFTYKNIETLRKKNIHTGEFMNGKYLCGSAKMVLIDKFSRKDIEALIKHSFENNIFETIFRKME